MLFQYDFYLLYSMARIALRGDNMYDRGLLEQEMLSHGWGADYVFGVGHPPWATAVLLPFAELPFTIARVLWLLTSLLAISYSIATVRSDLFSLQTKKDRPLSWPLFLLMSVCFFPIVETIMYGQLGWLQLLGITIFLSGLSKKNAIAEGLGLALTISKAHLLLPLYIFVGINFLALRRWKPLCWSIIGVSIQILLSLILAPNTYIHYFDGLQNFSGDARTLLSPTIAQIFVFVFGGNVDLRIAVAILGALVAAYLSIDARKSSAKESSELIAFVLLPLSLLCAPYCWGHDLIVLLIPFLIFANSTKQSGRRVSNYAAPLIFLFAYTLVSDRSALEMFKILVPASFLLAGTLWMKKYRSEAISPLS